MEIEIYPVTVETNIRNLGCYTLRCTSYSSIHFAVFLQGNNFLIHINFSFEILDLRFLDIFKSNYILLIKARNSNISIFIFFPTLAEMNRRN